MYRYGYISISLKTYTCDILFLPVVCLYQCKKYINKTVEIKMQIFVCNIVFKRNN